MSFLRWLDGLSRTVDKVLEAKNKVDVLIRVGHTRDSITRPIQEALDFVEGLEKNARREQTETDSKPEDGEPKR